jgi:putative transposase
VLDILVQSRRNKHAAKKFFRKLLKGLQWFCRKFSFEAICGMVSPTKPCCQGGERRWRSAAKEPIFRRILF